MWINKKSLNLLSLSAIQGGNAFFPIILLPYYMVIFPIEEFSILMTSEAVALIVVIFSTYGFDVVGMKKIVALPKNRIFLGKIFFGILYARLFILLFLTLIISLASSLFLEDYLYFLIAWMLFPLGIILQSSYFYQALESNFILAVFVLGARVVACVLAFTFAKEGSDIMLGLLIMSGSYFVSGLCSSIYICWFYKLSLVKSGLKMIPLLLKEGWVVFLGSVSVILYRGSNVIILTAISGNPVAVSLYALAEKFVKLLQALTLPISKFYTPVVLRTLVRPENDYLSVLWLNTKWQIIFSTVAVFLFFIVALVEVYYFSSFFSFDMLVLISLMVVAVPCGVANYMYGFIGFNAVNKGGVFASFTALAGIVSVFFSSFMAWALDGVGVALVYGLSEVLILILVVSYAKKFIICKR